MKTMHLFAGAGGGLLADLILGHTPIAAVEWDAYCCQVLRERAPEWFPELRVHEGDIRMFDASEYAGRVDCIHAGFPCQDISAAGKGAGIDGARSGLWREVIRAIDAIRPSFVFLENSPRIRTKGRDRVIAELVARGYAWRDGILAAADVGAPHKRDRWWCLAANTDGLRELQQKGGEQNIRRWDDHSIENSENADVMRVRCADSCGQPATQKSADIRYSVNVESREGTGTESASWFEVEPQVERLVYGMADGVVSAAIKALGNAQVPLQAALAWKLLGGP